MNNELEKSFQFYLDNLEKLAKTYKGKFITIKNCEILGAYDTYESALNETLKTHKLGTFLVQRVDTNPSTYTLYLNRFSVVNG